MARGKPGQSMRCVESVNLTTASDHCGSVARFGRVRYLDRSACPDMCGARLAASPRCEMVLDHPSGRRCGQDLVEVTVIQSLGEVPLERVQVTEVGHEARRDERVRGKHDP